MGKRKNGEGSYGKKTIKGNIYNFYRYPNGHYIYAKTMKELKIKIEKYNEIPHPKNNQYAKEYFGDYCVAWLKQICKPEVTAGTYDDYESTIANRIANYPIADVKIESLSIDMINEHLKKLSEKYSSSSIDKAWAIIKQVVRFGMDEKDMPEIPLNKIKIPKEKDVKVKKKEIYCISPDDMEELYQESKRKTVKGKNWSNASKVIVFIMYSGLRVSEAIGLKWKYVSSDLSTITVKESVAVTKQRDAEGNIIKSNRGKTKYKQESKDPKTKSGVREVPLPERAVEVLQYFKNNYPHDDDDFVFVTAGKKKYFTNGISGTLSAMLKQSNCKCKEYTPHSLRHGYGSILITNGVPIATVSKLLGHSSINITIKVYYHLLKDETAEQIKNVFDKKKITE